MLSPTHPAHQKQGKGSTLARQGGTDTLWTRVGFCVTMGQKLRNVPSKSLVPSIDEALSAIKLRRHSLTFHPPGGWVLKSVRWSGRCRIEALGHEVNLFGVQN